MFEKYFVLGMILMYWLGALGNALKHKGRGDTVWQFKIHDIREVFICGGWLAVYVLIGWRAYESEHSVAVAQLLIPGALFIIAMTLTQWCYHTLGSQWQVSKDMPDTYKLITTGPFKYLRHPIYVAQILIVLSCWVIMADWINFVVLTCFVALVQMKTRLEERAMILRFGSEYLAYMKRTH